MLIVCNVHPCPISPAATLGVGVGDYNSRPGLRRSFIYWHHLGTRCECSLIQNEIGFSFLTTLFGFFLLLLNHTLDLNFFDMHLSSRNEFHPRISMTISQFIHDCWQKISIYSWLLTENRDLFTIVDRRSRFIHDCWQKIATYSWLLIEDRNLFMIADRS